jgi:hypothetical protein
MVAAPAIVVADAEPASAHGIGGREPTNVRVRVVAVDPAVAGVDVNVVDAGTRLELSNTSDTDVVVFGYEGEPYLRIGPEGVFENARSPAVFLNRTLDPPTEYPDRYDPAAAPEWQRINGGTRVAWHDHRAHAMTDGAFETSNWTVPMEAAGAPLLVQGELAWVEPAPWWPWVLVSVGIAALVALAARRAWRLTVAITLELLVAAELLHVVGSWSVLADTFWARANAQLISVGAVGFGAFAAYRVVRRPPHASAPYALFAGVFLFIAGGLSDATVWFRSQLPSNLSPMLDRALVALAFGGGVGIIIASAFQLAPAEPQPDAAPATVP